MWYRQTSQEIQKLKKRWKNNCKGICLWQKSVRLEYRQHRLEFQHCEMYVARRTMDKKEGKPDQSGYHLIVLAKNEMMQRQQAGLMQIIKT